MEVLSQEQLEDYTEREIVVDRGQLPMRIDRYLCQKIKDISRTKIQLGIEQAIIRVNDKKVKASYQVCSQDSIKLLLPTPVAPKAITPEAIPLDICYEDEELLVLHKPAFMVVHPGKKNEKGTLVHALLYYFQERRQERAKHLVRAGLVHRIDKGTSGLLLVAKKESVRLALCQQFFHHTVHRKYIALVWGDLAAERGTIDQHLMKDPKDRRLVVAVKNNPPERAKRAVTHYQVLNRYGYVTHIACTLETGRTHQIRAHLQYLGHPLFGDPKYGGDRLRKGPAFSKYKLFVQNCFEQLPFQALHAAELGFLHPRTGQKMLFRADLPTNFQEILNRWKRYTAISPFYTN